MRASCLSFVQQPALIFPQGNFSSAFPLAAWAFLGYSTPVYLFGSNDGATFTLISTTAVSGAPVCASPPSSIPCSYFVNALPPASQPSFSFYRVVSPAYDYDYAATLFTQPGPSARALSLDNGPLAAADGAAFQAPAPSSPSPSRSLSSLVWIALATGGACAVAAGVVAVRRARIVRFSPLLAKATKETRGDALMAVAGDNGAADHEERVLALLAGSACPDLSPCVVKIPATDVI